MLDLFLFLYETCNVGVYTCLLILPLLLYKMYYAGREKCKVQGPGPNRSGQKGKIQVHHKSTNMIDEVFEVNVERW
jgi:hypothetical protein